MRVVSDTSPLSNLAIIGRLDLLKRRYGRVRIPPAVAQELAALTHPVARASLNTALAEGWVLVEDAPAAPALRSLLDAGEAEAISLAVGTRADLLLMDERRGREAARRQGLAVAGALGELLHARLAGWLPAVRPEIQRLRAEAGFFVDAEIERFILSQAGE